MSGHTNVPCALKEINSQLCALLLNATAFMSILLFYLPCRVWNHCKLTLEVDLMPVQVCLWCVPVLLQVCTWYAAICWSVGLHLTAEGVARDREDATGGWRERGTGGIERMVCVCLFRGERSLESSTGRSGPSFRRDCFSGSTLTTPFCSYLHGHV